MSTSNNVLSLQDKYFRKTVEFRCPTNVLAAKGEPLVELRHIVGMKRVRHVHVTRHGTIVDVPGTKLGSSIPEKVVHGDYS